jgi:tripartite-type tricarboxylate transporter receptor subunit TctC
MFEINPFVCCCAADKPYKTIGDLIEAVKAKPGELSYASAGLGSLLYISVPLVLKAAGVEDPKNAMIHVPYKGGGAAATATVGGHTDLICTNSSSLAGHIASGKLRPLLITTEERQDVAPGAPTARELGWSEVEVMQGWSALYGPPGMDKAIAEKLREMILKLKDDVAFKKLTTALGSMPHIMDTPETKAFVDSQYKAFSELVNELDMKIE